MRYLRWLQEQRFEHPAHQIALQEMVEAVRISKERVARIEEAIAEFVPMWSLGPVVRALQTLRGVDLIVAVTFATEVGGVTRFESPRQLMGYLGLVPSERSTDGVAADWHGKPSGQAGAGLAAERHADIGLRLGQAIAALCPRTGEAGNRLGKDAARTMAAAEVAHLHPPRDRAILPG